MTASAYVPYCGTPPIPADLMGRWNTDPVLLLGLAALTLLYARGARGFDARTRTAFYAGWFLVAACLVSPLCNLTVALFSARVSQHMILLLIAAPLVALGRAGTAWGRLLPRGVHDSRPARLGARALGNGPVAALLFALLLWGWHIPAFYDATLQGDAAYWAMHISLFASGVLLWHWLLPDRPEHSLAGVLIGFLTASQMSLLGALLTFAPAPLYDSHLATSWPWGLSALADQQLGGLIMWVPGGTVFVLAGLATLAAALARLERHHRESAAG